MRSYTDKESLENSITDINAKETSALGSDHKCIIADMRVKLAKIKEKSTGKKRKTFWKPEEEEKKTKRNNVVLSAAAVSAIAVFGIIMTL